MFTLEKYPNSVISKVGITSLCLLYPSPLIPTLKMINPNKGVGSKFKQGFDSENTHVEAPNGQWKRTVLFHFLQSSLHQVRPHFPSLGKVKKFLAPSPGFPGLTSKCPKDNLSG